jgi:glycosyltransferase involved in cell wall biosynthesis
MTHGSPAVRVLLVDPSLFSAPYDAALTDGLVAAGVDPRWAVRPTRPGDRAELKQQHADAFFYRHVDSLSSLPAPVRSVAKGLAHVVGLARLVRRVALRRPDVVHFQWTVFPALDTLAMLVIRRRSAVVLTVHDTTPCNGDRGPWLHRSGQRWPMRVAHRIIVHTKGARETLVDHGLRADTIDVIPHGPLRPPAASPSPRDARYTIVLFGELKPYKGIDVLIDAVALLPPDVRGQARVLIAGRAQMDVTPLVARIAERGLADVIDLQPRRLSEDEMAELFGRADCFVFPYRKVDASGVYFMVRSLSRWIIASRVGVFSEQLTERVDGDLVPPEDPSALAMALGSAVTTRAKPTAVKPAGDWSAIGGATLAAYRSALDSRDGSRGRPCESPA